MARDEEERGTTQKPKEFVTKTPSKREFLGGLIIRQALRMVKFNEGWVFTSKLNHVEPSVNVGKSSLSGVR